MIVGTSALSAMPSNSSEDALRAVAKILSRMWISETLCFVAWKRCQTQFRIYLRTFENDTQTYRGVQLVTSAIDLLTDISKSNPNELEM